MSTQPLPVLLTVDCVSNPAISALAGFVPWALSGIRTSRSLLARGRENRRPPPSMPSARLGLRRQVAGKPPAGRKSRPASLHFVQQLQHALHGFDRLVADADRQSRHARQSFVPLGVVLHRTRPERIKMRIDRHVQRRQVREVPNRLPASVNSGSGGGLSRAIRPMQLLRLRASERRSRQTLARDPACDSSNSNLVACWLRMDVISAIGMALC